MRHKLLKTQYNDVFGTLKDAELNPADFEWGEGNYRSKEYRRGISTLTTCPILKHKDKQDYYFQFELIGNEHSYTCCPGTETIQEHDLVGSWQKQVSAVSRWSRRLKKEIESPNLWLEMGKYQLAISSDITNNIKDEAISWKDAEEIAEKLNLLGDEIDKIYSLTSEQDDFVRDKLNYLANAAKKFTYKDWVFLSLGVFQIVAWRLTLTPEQMKQLGNLIKTFLDGFIHLLGN